MTTINDIAAKVAEENGLTKAQAKSAVEAVFKETADREGRNPATGATVTIAASKKLAFTPAKAVKDALKA